ncbi:MAG: hypothetical protein O3A00_04615 [Planctomycetota bacterium]|nr:hypothetical protein [Planctomycetota bacterium]
MSKLNDNLIDMDRSAAGPAYRWKRAQQLAQSQVLARIKHEDEQIQQATAYLRMFQEIGRESANQKYPTLAAACRIAENEQSFRVLKLSVLGSLPRAEVAVRLGAEQQVIDVAELLFFDIRGLSQASGWMNCHVFVPEAKFGSKELAAKLKLAHYGGPVVTRALLDGQDKLPLEQAQQIIDRELQLHAKLQAALEFDLDAKAAQQFLQVFLEYDLERKKLEFEREKFQFECALAREQRIDDQAKRDCEASIGAASDQGDSQDDERVQPAVVHSADDEQLVA